MLRTLMIVAFTLVATPAFAGKGDVSKDVAKEQRKEAKTFSRQLDRYARKWNKGIDKDREGKVARYDAKLGALYQQELGRLRDLGIQTRNVEEIEHPAHPGASYKPGSGRPKLDDLRDVVVELKDMQDRRHGDTDAKPQERRLLAELQRKAEARYARKDAKFEAAKARSS